MPPDAGLARRRVEPEELDHLSPADPRAQRSRLDLRRINALMGHGRLLARLLARHVEASPPRTILELGAGDGHLMLAVARRLAHRWPGVTVRLLDRQDLVPPEMVAAFARLGWRCEPVVGDIFAIGPDARADVVTANLVLHHFTEDQLRRLFGRLSALAPLVIACETRRTWLPLLASRCLGAIGANSVTRADGVLSVRAGFRDGELSRLWPDPDSWHLEEGAAAPFSHVFAARRRAGQGP